MMNSKKSIKQREYHSTLIELVLKNRIQNSKESDLDSSFPKLRKLETHF